MPSADVFSLFKRALSERGDIEESWHRNAMLYDGKIPRPDLMDQWQPDVEIPIAWERSTSQASRIVNLVLSQQPPFTVIPKNLGDPAETIKTARAIERYFEWKIRTWKRHSRTDWASWLFELIRHVHVYGFAAIHVFVKRERAVSLVRKTVTEVIRFPVAPPVPAEPGAPQFDGSLPEYPPEQQEAVVEKEIVTAEETPGYHGSVAELVDPRDFIWYPIWVDTLNDCSLVARRHFVTPWQLQMAANDGFFDPKAVSEVLKNEPPSASEQGAAKPSERFSGEKSERTGRYQIIEAYHWEPGSEETGFQPVHRVTFFEEKSQRVLRTSENMLTEFRIPFIVVPYEWRTGSLIGPSFVERISGIHMAVNASVNLDLEAAILSSSQAFATDDDDIADELRDRRVRPGEILRTTRNPREALMPLQFPGPSGQLGALRQYMEQHADMLSSTSPALFGMEQAQRPTFKGTMALIEEAKQPLYRFLETVRSGLSEMAYHILARDREEFDFRVPFYEADEDGALVSKVILSLPDGLLQEMLSIDLRASSELANKQSRQQLLSDALDRVSTVYQQILQFVQTAQSGSQDSPINLIALRGAKVLSSLLEEAAKEFDLPGADVVAPDVEEELNAGKVIAEIFQGALAQAVQQLQAAAAQQAQQPGGPAGPGQPQGPTGAPSPGPNSGAGTPSPEAPGAPFGPEGQFA